MPTRVEIRHSVVDALKTVPGLSVFYEQHITDLDVAMPCAVVYFTTVDVEEDLSGGRTYSGQLNISTFVKGTDDVIDPLVDKVIAATDTAIKGPNPLGSAWTLNNIQYDHEVQPGTTSCTTVFTIWFTD